MVPCIGVVHGDVHVIMDLVHHNTIFSITVDHCYHESGFIEVSEYHDKGAIIFIVLPGLNQDHSSIFDSLVYIPHSFTNMGSMHSSSSRCLEITSFGISIKSLRTGFSVVLVDLPLRLDIDGPNVRSAIVTSLDVTGQFCITLVRSKALKLAIVGVPTAFRALSHCLWV